MTLLDVMIIVAVFSLTITILLLFTIGKGVGFKNLYGIFCSQNEKRKVGVM